MRSRRHNLIFGRSDERRRGPDGTGPQGGLIVDAVGRLYGVASGGGTGYGVVFRPAYGLLADSQGHLFGTAYYGGTVFEVTP